MSYAGWIGNILLFTGIVSVGRKWRPAFLFQAAGEIVWCYAGYERGQADLIVICALFTAMALYNYVLWGRDKSPTRSTPVQVQNLEKI